MRDKVNISFSVSGDKVTVCWVLPSSNYLWWFNRKVSCNHNTRILIFFSPQNQKMLFLLCSWKNNANKASSNLCWSLTPSIKTLFNKLAVVFFFVIFLWQVEQFPSSVRGQIQSAAAEDVWIPSTQCMRGLRSFLVISTQPQTWNCSLREAQRTGTCLKSHRFPHLTAFLSAVGRCVPLTELTAGTRALKRGFPSNTADGRDGDPLSSVAGALSLSVAVWDLVSFSAPRDWPHIFQIPRIELICCR